MSLFLSLALLLAGLPALAANVADGAKPTSLPIIPALTAAAPSSSLTGAAAAGVEPSAIVPPATFSLPAGISAAASPAPRSEESGAAEGVLRLETELKEAFRVPESLDEITLEGATGHAYMPSPVDWRDETLYSIFVDRFAKSADGKPVGDPAHGLTRHGGDLKGITQKLDYLNAAVTTIVLSPVTETVPEAYHGYAPIHFMKIDPHLGTMEDFKALVREAHKRGIRVVLDLVINHTGPVFEYEGGPKASGFVTSDKPAKNIGPWEQDLKPSELKDPARFTRRGVIADWTDHEQFTKGDFPPNYRHLATDDARTQEVLIKIASWWIKEGDIDGLRLDAIRHVDQGFLKRFAKEVKTYAKTLGKDNFFLLGEDSTGIDHALIGNFGAGLDSVYNYPEYRRVNKALHGKEPTSKLEDSFRRSRQALGDVTGRLVRFIDLHDTYRFLRDGESLKLLTVALAFLMLSFGIPMVYYGTEQGFRTKHGRLEPEGGDLPADPENRQDMFADGQFKTESSSGDKFQIGSETFQFLRRMKELRAKYPALRRGEQYARWSDPSGPGLYAFSRIYDGQEVLVVMNTAEEARSAEMFVAGELNGPGTVFFDEMDASYGVTSHMSEGGGSKVRVELPPLGVRVLVRRS